MRTIEVGKPARTAQDQLIVECRVESGVEAGCRVGGTRKRISSLEVTVGPVTGERGLKRMIVRVGIIGKDFETGVTVDALEQASSHAIGNRIGGNDELLAIRAFDRERILRTDQNRLKRVVGLSQMYRMAAHVSCFQDPTFPECPLQRQVPLLHVRRYEVFWHLEREEVDRIVVVYGDL